LELRRGGGGGGEGKRGDGIQYSHEALTSSNDEEGVNSATSSTASFESILFRLDRFSAPLEKREGGVKPTDVKQDHWERREGEKMQEKGGGDEDGKEKEIKMGWS